MDGWRELGTCVEFCEMWYITNLAKDVSSRSGLHGNIVGCGEQHRFDVAWRLPNFTQVVRIEQTVGKVKKTDRARKNDSERW